ncbi:hypothetical protein ALI22I_37730 [Saccharothrix sp. ALI-22-I]|nr:hypothetical protein ALI22I_37730 [Saccharothrix sp. ALI-22-I]
MGYVGYVGYAGYWVRVGVGDVPPPAVPLPEGKSRWVRATTRTAKPAVAPPSRSAESESETRETWLVDSFELVVPRYPWQKDGETGP